MVQTQSADLMVSFQPGNGAAAVPKGTTLLDAAVKAGVTIETPCGGQGRCGRCRVRITRGQVAHAADPHLSAEQTKEGWALACTARVASDVDVVVPPLKEREQTSVETVPSQTPPLVKCDWPFYPSVRRHLLKLPPPTLDDNAADLDRLNKVLAEKAGVDRVLVGLPMLARLSRDLREQNWHLRATIRMHDTDNTAQLIDLQPRTKAGPLLAAAIDIGTTNVVIDLVDLRSGKVIERASARNKQASCGEDIISRIIYSQRDGGLQELQRLVVETINELFWGLAERHGFYASEIEEVVVAGNTTMSHLFLGLSPQYIRLEPYTPATTHFPVATAGEVGLWSNPLASVYCLPAVAAYVGGDISGGVLSSCLFKADKLTLFLDVGTNGEIVLGNRDWMTAVACSAGPAFEGAGVRHGMRATTGAIEDVRIHSGTSEPTIRVIGDTAPLGICGSGMISVLAEMFLTGLIDRSGRFNRQRLGSHSRIRQGNHGLEYVIARDAETGTGEDIVITEVDIDNLVRVKAAIYAGITVMIKKIGISPSDIEEVLIGGAFGQHINIEQAIQIGLLPDLPWDRFRYLGNTSLWGAYNVLVSKYARANVEELARGITYLELVAEASFMEEFTAAMFLPHTDINRFPAVKAAFDGTRQMDTASNKE